MTLYWDMLLAARDMNDSSAACWAYLKLQSKLDGQGMVVCLV